MREYFVPMLLLKDAVDNMAAKELHFQPASEANIFCNRLVSLREGMANDHSIDFFEFSEFLDIGFEVVCEFAYWNFFLVRNQKFGIFVIFVGNLIEYFAQAFVVGELIFNESHGEFVDIEPEGNFLKISQEFDRSYLIYDFAKE